MARSQRQLFMFAKCAPQFVNHISNDALTENNSTLIQLRVSYFYMLRRNGWICFSTNIDLAFPVVELLRVWTFKGFRYFVLIFISIFFYYRNGLWNGHRRMCFESVSERSHVSGWGQRVQLRMRGRIWRWVSSYLFIINNYNKWYIIHF